MANLALLFRRLDFRQSVTRRRVPVPVSGSKAETAVTVCCHPALLTNNTKQSLMKKNNHASNVVKAGPAGEPEKVPGHSSTR